MSWYDNLTDTGAWGRGISNAFGVGAADPSNPDRSALRGNAQAQAGFGQQALGNYGQSNGALNGTYGQMGQTQGYLQGVMNGTTSQSAPQLQQGLAQNMAAQQSMAASQPGNVASARVAGMNNAQMSAGLAGQQQIAGMQERNAAASQLNQSQQNQAALQYGARGQDATGANAAYGTGTGAYDNAEKNPMKTGGSLLGGGIGGVVGLFSDERLKENIADADDEASDMMERISNALTKRLAKIGAAK